MERSAVAHAIAQLQAEGRPVSNQNIKRLLGYGSMRDIVQHRRALETPEGAPVAIAKALDAPAAPVADDGLDETPWLRGRRDSTGVDVRPRRADAPAPPPEPLAPWNMAFYDAPNPERPDYSQHPAVTNGAPADPAVRLARAEVALLAAETDVDERRTALRGTLLELWVVGGVVVDGQRYGALATGDPARDAAKEAARAASQDYDAAWSALVQAQATLHAAQRKQGDTAKQAFVEKHHPALVKELAETTDRARYVQKVKFQELQHRYQSALAAAPVTGE